eukprot:749625-Hanusia_phi.AAC.1
MMTQDNALLFQETNILNDEVENLSRQLDDALADREEMKFILHQHGLLRGEQPEQQRWSREEDGEEEEDGGEEEFHMSLKLDMKMQDVAGKEEQFMDEVCEDVAAAVGGDNHKVKVRGMQEGSIILDIVLLEGICGGEKSARVAAEELRAQAGDPTSRLRSGKHTSKTSSLDIVWHSQEVGERQMLMEEERKMYFKEEDRQLRMKEEERARRWKEEEERQVRMREEERARRWKEEEEEEERQVRSMEEERQKRQQTQGAGARQEDILQEPSDAQLEEMISSRSAELVLMHQLQVDLEELQGSTEDKKALEMSERMAALIEQHEVSIKELARVASMAEEYRKGQREAEERLIKYKEQVYQERKRMMKASASSFNEHEVLQRRLESKSPVQPAAHSLLLPRLPAGGGNTADGRGRPSSPAATELDRESAGGGAGEVTGEQEGAAGAGARAGEGQEDGGAEEKGARLAAERHEPKFGIERSRAGDEEDRPAVGGAGGGDGKAAGGGDARTAARGTGGGL